MSFGEKGNGTVVDVCHVQGCEYGPFLHPGQHPGTEKLSSGFVCGAHLVFQGSEEALEVFFTVATSSGSECLIFVNPRLAM